jgi:hypothetical protein
MSDIIVPEINGVTISAERNDNNIRYRINFSCDEKDFIKDLTSNEKNEFLCSSLIYSLEELSWCIQGVNADMWMGVLLKSDSGDEIHIECELLEAGLLASKLLTTSINEQRGY